MPREKTRRVPSMVKVNTAFTLSFVYPVRIFQDYNEAATTISSITAKDIATLEYSYDGNIYTPVSFPLSNALTLNAGWVWYRIGFQGFCRRCGQG